MTEIDNITITVPVRKLRERELAGLRQNMLEAGPHAVSTGGGLGSDGIWLEVGESGGGESSRAFYVLRGVDLLGALLHELGHADEDLLPVSKQMAAMRAAR